jgi:hypothetical protein
MAYAVIFIAGLGYTISDDGGMYSGPALATVVVSEPWFSLIGPLVGNKMSYPEKLNEEIDDDSFSTTGMLVLAFSGTINAAIIYAAFRFSKKSN